MFQVKSNGDVAQDQNANGLVKAAANVFCSTAGSKVDNYFNSVGNTVTITNGEDMGHCSVNFHFDLTKRYISAMVTSDVPAGANCLPDSINTTTLTCYIYHFNPTDTYLEYGEISIVIY
jgi:hypothetical protein